MSYQFIVITLLALIFIVLIIILVKSLNKNPVQDTQDIEKIEKQISSLLHKTIEQNGYVNSKLMKLEI